MILNPFPQALYGRRFGFNEPQRASEFGAAVGYCYQKHPHKEGIHIAHYSLC